MVANQRIRRPQAAVEFGAWAARRVGVLQTAVLEICLNLLRLLSCQQGQWGAKLKAIAQHR